MARLILLLMLFAVLALAVAAAATALRALRTPPHPSGSLPAVTEDRMPRAMQNVAYVVLLLLLAGLTSGVLGPS